MANTNSEARKRNGLAYYYRKAADPAWRAAQAAKMRNARASMAPDEKAAYLAKKAAKHKERMRSDPEYRAKQHAAIKAAYHRRKAVEPMFAAEQARRGYERNVAWRLANSAGARAKKKGLKFDLTKEWAETAYTGKCELTGIEFIVARKSIGPFSPSIDRIDPMLGYVQGNCRFILMGVNSMKNTGTDADVFRIAKALLGIQDA